jgi:hypothetical protein
MIELAKPSGEEKAYRVVLLLCSIGGFAIGLTEILLHLIWGSVSDGLGVLVFLLFVGIPLSHWGLRTCEQRRRDGDALCLFKAFV